MSQHTGSRPPGAATAAGPSASTREAPRRTEAGSRQPPPSPGTLLIERDGALLASQLSVGAVLLDARGAAEGSIPFCCRSAGCGTCRVEVLAGGEHLAPPADDELDVLDIYGADASRVRLACQARLLRGGVSLRVRPLEP